jgi:hypothetical protein
MSEFDVCGDAVLCMGLRNGFLRNFINVLQITCLCKYKFCVSAMYISHLRFGRRFLRKISIFLSYIPPFYCIRPVDVELLSTCCTPCAEAISIGHACSSCYSVHILLPRISIV